MHTLKITLGGESLIVSLRNTGILNAIVNCVDLPEQERNYVELDLGGLDTVTESHLRWDRRSLSIGDKVIIEIINPCDGDPPDRVDKRVLDFEEDKKIDYLRRECAKLGWTITEAES
jgi:hypothetical protein